MTDATPQQEQDRQQHLRDIAQLIPHFLRAVTAATSTSLNPPDTARTAGMAFRAIMEVATHDAPLPAAEVAALVDELADAFKSGLNQNMVAIKANVPDGATVAGASDAVH